MEDWGTGESLISQHIEMYNTKLSSKEIIGNLKMKKVMWEPTGRTVSKDDRVSQGMGFITHKGTEMWPGPNEVRDLKLRLLQKAETHTPSHTERRIRKTLLSAQGSLSFPQALRRKKKDYVGDFNPQWAVCECGD